MNATHTDTDIIGALGDAEDGDFAATATRLSGQLERRAQADGLLDVAYRTLDSPVGPLLLAATKAGLVTIAFAGEGHERVLEELSQRISPRILQAPARLDPASRELDEYFAGTRRHFELALDFQLSRGFRRVVLDRLTEIAYGDTASYGSIALAAGSPRAVRAVGSACATNPLPLVIPCHRVLRSDGSLGGYGGGLDAKRTLLALEGALG
jgi:methylated-DNA-[protein]-cysteine S-methyltransferase